MVVSILTPANAVEYRELRLASLHECPIAYCTDISEEQDLPLTEFEKRVSPRDEAVTFAAFDQGRMVGIATLLRSPRVRLRFRATIAAMYVLPAYRNRGVATSLLAAVADHARTLPEVEEVCLCVTVGNDPARRVYAAFGFEHLANDPRYFKYEGQYYDLEWLRLPLNRS